LTHLLAPLHDGQFKSRCQLGRQVKKRSHFAQADLYLRDGLSAEIEINEPGSGLFEDEIAEMLEFLKDAKGKSRKRVEKVLKDARRIISVRVLGQDREAEDTLAGVDPLWKWLFSTRRGLLQADGEGYYDADDLIVEESW
jgi:hypothetical protein